MTRCFAKVLLPTPFHHDSEIAKSVRTFAEATRAVWVHWPLRGKENTGRAPEALLEYASVHDRVNALKENQARPGEWGFFATADKRQPDDKRRKVRRRDALADCEVRVGDQMPEYDGDWDYAWERGSYQEYDTMPLLLDTGYEGPAPMQALQPLPLQPQQAPPLLLPDHVQLQQGVHMPECYPERQAYQRDWCPPRAMPYAEPQYEQGLFAERCPSYAEPRCPPSYAEQYEPRCPPAYAEPRDSEPRRSPIIVVDSAGQTQELWSFTATHGVPGFGTWQSAVPARGVPTVEFEDDEASLLDAARAASLTIDCALGADEELEPMPTPMPMPTPTRFGFIHFELSDADSPVRRRRSRSQPPASMVFDMDTPLPVRAPMLSPREPEDSEAEDGVPQTPPRTEKLGADTPMPISAKKRRGGRGRHGKAKPE